MGFSEDHLKDYQEKGYFPSGNPLVAIEPGTIQTLLDRQLQFKSDRLKSDWFKPSEDLLQLLDELQEKYPVKPNVIDSVQSVPPCAHTEAEAEAIAADTHVSAAAAAPAAYTSPVIDSQSQSLTVRFDKAREAMIKIGITDPKAADRVLLECFEQAPEVSDEEIAFWVRYVWQEAQRSRTLRNPRAFVISAVARHVGTNTHWREMDAAEAAKPQADPVDPEQTWEAKPQQPLAITAWGGILQQLEKIIIRQSFDTWLKPTRGWEIADSKLYVRIPSPEFQHIGAKYREEIRKAIGEQRLPVAEVQFVVNPEEVP